jgi:hypothetical protein
MRLRVQPPRAAIAKEILSLQPKTTGFLWNMKSRRMATLFLRAKKETSALLI